MDTSVSDKCAASIIGIEGYSLHVLPKILRSVKLLVISKMKVTINSCRFFCISMPAYQILHGTTICGQYQQNYITSPHINGS
jgi:hypothetical protein